jgi:probable phosphoglycerate mutase
VSGPGVQRQQSGVLLLARHGETDWNAAGRIQGQSDIPLNEAGRVQARALAARLRQEGLAAVGCSDLSRARETAEIVAGELGLAVTHISPALRERAYGLFEGLTSLECEARHPDEWARFADPLATPPSGEPLKALEQRMLQAAYEASEFLALPALVVSHGRALRALVAAVTGQVCDPIPNAGVVRLVLEAGRWTSARLDLPPGP